MIYLYITIASLYINKSNTTSLIQALCTYQILQGAMLYCCSRFQNINERKARWEEKCELSRAACFCVHNWINDQILKVKGKLLHLKFTSIALSVMSTSSKLNEKETMKKVIFNKDSANNFFPRHLSKVNIN